ncbi:hypothetical protein BASA61_003196 [Batrachochytrium salamandrivorans]|nr:hypothetical protein BASA61_003196 [Batrachochytrium salamandrivorans]
MISRSRSLEKESLLLHDDLTPLNFPKPSVPRTSGKMPEGFLHTNAIPESIPSSTICEKSKDPMVRHHNYDKPDDEERLKKANNTPLDSLMTQQHLEQRQRHPVSTIPTHRIGTKRQSISHMLNATLMNAIKMFDSVDPLLPKSSVSSETLHNSFKTKRESCIVSSQKALPLVSHNTTPAVPHRELTVEEDLNYHSHSNLRHRLIQKLDQLDPFDGTDALDSTQGDISRHLLGMDQKLFHEFQKPEHDFPVEQISQQEDQRQIHVIMSECNQKLETLRQARCDILGIQKFSDNDDEEIDDKEMDTIKPQITSKTLLKPDVLASIYRTDTGLKEIPFGEKKGLLREIDTPGILEVDFESPNRLKKHGAATFNSRFSQQKSDKTTTRIEQYSAELKILNRINNRVYYLRNPRFSSIDSSNLPYVNGIRRLTSNTALSAISSDDNMSTQVGPTSYAPPKHSLAYKISEIIAEPSTIYFKEYTPYCTYKKTLTIRNSGQIACRFRVNTRPPYTYSKFFSCKLTKCPIDKEGLVAPGLSCEYTISFTPNSYANFYHTLCVSTEMGKSFEVNIVAKRTPPDLTLPSILNCGPCRKDSIKLKSWDFCNKGGAGRFKIIGPDEDLDPFTVFDKIGVNGNCDTEILRIGCFEIYPSYFSLDHDESSQITVRYLPSDAHTLPNNTMHQEHHDSGLVSRNDRVVLRVVCDNCQTLELPVTGIAEIPKVQIVQIEKHTGEIVTHDKIDSDQRFDLIHNFGDQNPHGVSSMTIVVRNLTHLKLPFKWEHCDNQDERDSFLVEKTKPNASFNITNAKGWLKANGETTFTIEFTPESVRPFDVMAEFLLLNDTHAKESSNNRLCTLGGPGEEKLLMLRLMGTGVSYKVQLDTHLLYLPKILRSGEQYRGRLQITNYSVWKLPFEWMLEGIDCRVLDIMFSGRDGVVPPQSCSYIDMVIIGGFPSTIMGTLVCITANGTGPTLRIPICVTVGLEISSLVFDMDVIDFGLLALGEKKFMKVPLVNNSPMTIVYELSAQKQDCVGDEINSYLMCTPSKGVIAAKSTRMIDLTFIPTWYQQLRGVLECRVHALWFPELDPIYLHNHDIQTMPFVVASAIEMISTVQTPRIEILDPHTCFSCFCNVPVKIRFTLKNQTMLPTKYEWHPVNKDEYSVKFSPRDGELAGGKMVEIQIELEFHVVGTHNNLELFGVVDGMVENRGQLCTSMDVHVNPLEVSFRIVEVDKEVDAHAVIKHTRKPQLFPNRSAYLIFDFGATCPIFETRERTITIQNHSAMSSPFKFWLEKYHPSTQIDSLIDDLGQEILDSGISNDEKKVKYDPQDIHITPKPLLLSPTKVHKIGFNSKSGQGYIDNIKRVRHMIQRMKTLLADGRGAAFHASPAQGIIQPWGKVKVRITSYNNLVGLYEDFLWCEIGNWVKRKIPVRLGVVGTPVRFYGPQLVAKRQDNTNEADRVNFGARVINPGWGGGDNVRVGLSPHYCSETRCSPDLTSGSRTSRVSNHENKDLDIPTPFTKSIMVENQSPRDIVLKWKVFIRKSGLHERTSEEFDSFNADEMMFSQYQVNEGEAGIIEVSPSVLTIPAFEAAPLKCIYRSAVIGSFDALIIADVGYVESDGSLRFAPTRCIERPMATDGMIGGSVKIGDLNTAAKLHIQAKCIEPKLSLDDANGIRIKYATQQKSTDGNPITKVNRSVSAFLKNDSDAVCSFTLEALPADLFSVSGPKSSLKTKGFTPNRSPENEKQTQRKRTGDQTILQVYELKPIEQLLVTVKYSGAHITRIDSPPANQHRLETNDTHSMGADASLVRRTRFNLAQPTNASIPTLAAHSLNDSSESLSPLVSRNGGKHPKTAPERLISNLKSRNEPLMFEPKQDPNSTTDISPLLPENVAILAHDDQKFDNIDPAMEKVLKHKTRQQSYISQQNIIPSKTVEFQDICKSETALLHQRIRVDHKPSISSSSLEPTVPALTNIPNTVPAYSATSPSIKDIALSPEDPRYVLENHSPLTTTNTCENTILPISTHKCNIPPSVQMVGDAAASQDPNATPTVRLKSTNFHPIVTGEIVITFSNNMTQSIPIVVEESVFKTK